LLGRMPATVGYQPTLMSEVAELQERIISTRGGDITAVEAVYVPGDDMTDPAVSTILSHLDTTVILSRSQAAKGIYPTVDPLQSSSKMMGRVFWGTGITQWLRMYVSIWRVTRNWKTLSQIFPDSIDGEEFRQPRVLLRWKWKTANGSI